MLKFQYLCENGSETIAWTASVALQLWYWRHLPDNLPEMPQFGVLYTAPSGPPCYSPEFLPAIAAACERKWNRMPPVEDDSFDRGDLPKAGLAAEEVERRRDAGETLVVAYEQRCLRVLEWLREHGDIVALDVSDVTGTKWDKRKGTEGETL